MRRRIPLLRFGVSLVSAVVVDTLHLSGAGWQAGDTLDVVLDETPQNHPPVSWAIGVGADGTIADSTYVVQESDAGVTFNITATSRATGETAQATFTDGATVLSIVSIDPASPEQSAAFDINISVDSNGSGSGRVWMGTGWNIDAGAVTCVNTANQNTNGTYTLTITGAVAPATTGSHTLHVQAYADDLCADQTGGDKTLAFTVAAPTSVATTTTVSSAPDPSVTGQQVTFTATVKNGAIPVTTGTVTFRIGSTSCSDGTVLAADVALDASGQATATATYNASDSPVSVRACYSGATGFDASSGTETQTINKAGTTTAIGASPNPSTYGGSVTFTATISVTAPGAGTPTGSVKFYEFGAGGTCASPNGTLLSTQTVSAGSAAFSTNALAAASSPHAITACYSGDNDFSGSDHVVSQVVNPAPLTITASSGTKKFGTSYTVTPSYSGFVLGQTETTAGVITTAPTCSSPGSDLTATVTGSPYTTSCTGAVAPNYSITYVPGSLVVTAAKTTLTLEAPVCPRSTATRSGWRPA